MKHIKHQDAVLSLEPNEQLSSWFSVAQTQRPLVVELMLVDDHSTWRQLSVEQQNMTIAPVR